MKSLIIPIHSSIDLITNSSSELFITSDRQTVAQVKQILDLILSDLKTNKTSTDLYDISLESVDGGYGDYDQIKIEARDADFVKSAEALNKLNDIFTAKDIGND